MLNGIDKIKLRQLIKEERETQEAAARMLAGFGKIPTDQNAVIAKWRTAKDAVDAALT